MSYLIALIAYVSAHPYPFDFVRSSYSVQGLPQVAVASPVIVSEHSLYEVLAIGVHTYPTRHFERGECAYSSVDLRPLVRGALFRDLPAQTPLVRVGAQDNPPPTATGVRVAGAVNMSGDCLLECRSARAQAFP